MDDSAGSLWSWKGLIGTGKQTSIATDKENGLMTISIPSHIILNGAYWYVLPRLNNNSQDVAPKTANFLHIPLT